MSQFDDSLKTTRVEKLIFFNIYNILYIIFCDVLQNKPVLPNEQYFHYINVYFTYYVCIYALFYTKHSMFTFFVSMIDGISDKPVQQYEKQCSKKLNTFRTKRYIRNVGIRQWQVYAFCTRCSHCKYRYGLVILFEEDKGMDGSLPQCRKNKTIAQH